MDEWREQLRRVIDGWEVSPEEQSAIFDELEQHLEEDLAENSPRIGNGAALERIIAQVNDPALRTASIKSRRNVAPSVQASRTYATGFAAIMRDMRHGWRALRATPGTSIMATVALATGIGLTTVMFTIIYSLLLRGLPFEQADRIAMVMEANPSQGEPELSLSMHDFQAFRDVQQTFTDFGAWVPTTLNIAGDSPPERVDAARITAAAMTLPRIAPQLGRTFRDEDELPGSELVVILSHNYWRDHYAMDSAILGRAIRVNGQVATVVGVMPGGFGFPRESKVWIPLRYSVSSAEWGNGTHFNGVARLKRGVTYDQARAELAQVARRIETDHPASNKGVITVVQPFIRAVIPQRASALLYAMFGAVALVFLVACVNVANLLVARATFRTKEVAIRIALGASRIAIARQFLTEAFILSVIAAAFGALIAQGGLIIFRAVTTGELPFWAVVRLDPQVFVFIAFAALLASIVSGILPAITAARSDVNDVLKDQMLGSSSLRAGRLSRTLVIFELALATALLVVAALTTKSVLNVRSIEPGFRTQGVITASLTLSARDSVRRETVLRQLERGLMQLPGVQSATLGTGLPGTGWHEARVAIEGKTYANAQRFPSIRELAFTPEFFKTFDVAAHRGRLLNVQDRLDALPVAVINQQFADRFFLDADPLGRRINLAPTDSVAKWVTIVGIVPNLYATDQGSINAQQPWPPEVITPFAQRPRNGASIAIRTENDIATTASQLRAIVAALDADLPVYAVAPMTEVLAKSRWDVRVFGGLFIVFGVVALLLASIGLYAVLAFAVGRREREMGIRMALGAAAADIAGLVLRDAAFRVVLGLAIGSALGIGMARLASAVLFQVQPADPVILVAVIGTLVMTSLAACVLPVIRATNADPVRSLRAD